MWGQNGNAVGGGHGGATARVAPSLMAVAIAASERSAWRHRLDCPLGTEAWFGLTRSLAARLAPLAALARRGDLHAYAADGGGTPSALVDRLIASVTSAWLEAVDELIDRLVSDSAEIQHTLAGGRACGPVVYVVGDLSAPRVGGRSVTLLQFASGLAIVYKPRDVSADRAIYGLIEWVNAQGSRVPLRVPALLDRADHGWQEFVPPRPCASVPERERYSRRFGTMLGLAYALGSTGIDDGDIVAHGEFPVPVDCSRFIGAPLLRSAAAADGERTAGECRAWDSVLRTTLLKPGSDVSTNHVVDGLGEVLQRLRDHRSSLYDAGGPLAAIGGARYRVAWRSSSFYAEHLARAAGSGSVVDDGTWRDALSLMPLAGPASADACVHGSELDALTRLDVPDFHARGNTRDLSSGNRVSIARALVEPALEGIWRRLDSLNDDTLLTQQHLARVTLTHAGERAARPSAASGPASRDTAVASIVDRLTAAALTTADGTVTWVRSAHESESPFLVKPLGWDLYRGRTGIACVLAAQSTAAGNDDAGALAIRVLQPLADRTERDWLRERRAGIGIGHGVAGAVYALARVGSATGSAGLLDAAGRVARHMPEEAIAHDRALDLLNGAAGSLLALLVLHDVSGDPQALAQAESCGRRLQEAWSRSAAPHAAAGRLSRLAHGWPGMAYALSRLYARTADERIRRVALDIWDTVPSPLRDVPVENPKKLALSWCQGVAGVGLARLACARLIDAPHLVDEVARLADYALRHVAILGEADYPCCGKTGTAAFLQAAGSALHRQEWIDAAEEIACGVAVRAAAVEHAYARGTSDPLLAPSLFLGIAGIAYELLRGARPALPSLLMFE